MAAINFILRVTPLALFSRIELPRAVQRWLSFVPIAVMGALVASEVFPSNAQWSASTTGPGVIASVATMIAFRFTRSFLGSTLVGMLSFVLLRSLAG